jgi:hypothetical protein
VKAFDPWKFLPFWPEIVFLAAAACRRLWARLPAPGQYDSGFHRTRERSERRAQQRISVCQDRRVGARYSPTQREIWELRKTDRPGGQWGNGTHDPGETPPGSWSILGRFQVLLL